MVEQALEGGEGRAGADGAAEEEVGRLCCGGGGGGGIVGVAADDLGVDVEEGGFAFGCE